MNFGSWLGAGFWIILRLIYEIASHGRFGHPEATINRNIRMIKKLILKNFKGVENQTYDFSDFDLLVGSNNSGKSTVLQAIAIWGFCIEVFRQSDRTGVTGTRVLLPNFTALPLPEFNLLWHERTERKGVKITKDDKQINATKQIEIEIGIVWDDRDAVRRDFTVNLR